jgi:hypothetical protein
MATTLRAILPHQSLQLDQGPIAAGDCLIANLFRTTCGSSLHETLSERELPPVDWTEVQ